MQILSKKSWLIAAFSFCMVFGVIHIVKFNKLKKEFFVRSKKYTNDDLFFTAKRITESDVRRRIVPEWEYEKKTGLWFPWKNFTIKGHTKPHTEINILDSEKFSLFIATSIPLTETSKDKEYLSEITELNKYFFDPLGVLLKKDTLVTPDDLAFYHSIRRNKNIIKEIESKAFILSDMFFVDKPPGCFYSKGQMYYFLYTYPDGNTCRGYVLFRHNADMPPSNIYFFPKIIMKEEELMSYMISCLSKEMLNEK